MQKLTKYTLFHAFFSIFSTTLPWSISNSENKSGKENSSIPSFSLHKTRSSPSIFAMSAKSGLNPDLIAESSESSIATNTSNNDLLQANIDMVAHNIHTYYKTHTDQYATVVSTPGVSLLPVSQPDGMEFESRTLPKNTGPSPNTLRRSLTMHCDENCDLSNKSSTLPHDFNR